MDEFGTVGNGTWNKWRTDELVDIDRQGRLGGQ